MGIGQWGQLVGQWEYLLNNTTAVRMIRKGKRYFFSSENDLGLSIYTATRSGILWMQ